MSHEPPIAPTPAPTPAAPARDAAATPIPSATAPASAPIAQTPAKPWYAIFGQIRWAYAIESALIAGLVSAVVSGTVLVWGTARIETSKEEIASIVRQKSALDSAQTTVFSQLGLYTGKLFDKPESANKEQIQSAIITTQLQVTRLLNEVPKNKYPALLEYSKELDILSKSLREVKSKTDLAPVYDSAQKLLAIHDKVSEQLHKDMEISVFWKQKS